jgi:hypothetical protein
MPPAKIAAHARFFMRGITMVNICTSILNYNSPTRAELDAGLDVTRQLRGMDGWTLERDFITGKDFATTFNKQQGGELSIGDCSLEFHGARNAQDARNTLPMDATGFVVVGWGGDIAGYKMDVFPVQSGSVGKMPSDSELFGLKVKYAVTDVPAIDVTIP